MSELMFLIWFATVAFAFLGGYACGVWSEAENERLRRRFRR